MTLRTRPFDPNAFYIHNETHGIRQGKEWDETEWTKLTELIWIEDDFEYGKGHFVEVDPTDFSDNLSTSA